MFSHPLRAPLGLLLLCAACQPIAVPPPVAAGKSVAPTALAAPSALATVAPASPARSAPVALPATPIVLVSGTAAIEPSTLLSDRGLTLVAGGGLQLPAALVSSNGASLIRDAEAGQSGSQLFAGVDSLLNDDGSGLLSDNGGALGGHARFVSVGFGLLQAAPITAAPGTLAPVAGLEVRVFSLRTGRPFAFVRADGTPVFPLYTGAGGAFTVPVPAFEQGNVLITADVPGANDHRLQYGVLAPAKTATALAVDEDSALAADYVRLVLRSYLQRLLGLPDAASLAAQKIDGAPSVALAQGFEPLRAAAFAAGYASRSEAARQDLARALADGLVARLDLATTPTLPAKKWGGAAEPVLPMLTTLLHEIRTKSGLLLVKNPLYFDYQQREFLKRWRARNPGRAEVPITRAADPAAFIVREVLASDALNTYHEVRWAFGDIGMNDGSVDPATGLLRPDETEHLKGAVNGLALAVAALLTANQEGLRDQAIARINVLPKAP